MAKTAQCISPDCCKSVPWDQGSDYCADCLRADMVSDSGTGRARSPREAPERVSERPGYPDPLGAPESVPGRHQGAYGGPGDILRPGMRVRLAPGGPIWTVTRVNVCAAYVRKAFSKTITTQDGETTTFEAMTQPEAISPTAHVYVVEEGE